MNERDQPRDAATAATRSAAAPPHPFAEWFLLIGVILMIAESVFSGLPLRLMSMPFWVSNWLPFNLALCEVYFMGFGLAIVLLSPLFRRRPAGRPVMGAGLLALAWLVYGFAAYRGAIRGQEDWLQDLRGLMFGSLSIPTFLWLARRVRAPLVFTWCARLCVPIAMLYALAGIRQIVEGSAGDPNALLQARWSGGYAILLLFMLASGRLLIRPGASRLLPALFAAAALAPLSKPVLALFIYGGILFAVLASMALRRRLGSVGIRILTLGAIIIAGIVWTLSAMLDSSGGYAQEHLRKRILKEGASAPDLSGGRFEAWTFCLDQWRTAPWLGTGLGLHAEAMSQAGFIRTLPVHNLALQTLMQAGALGLAVILLILATWLRRVFWHLPREPDAALRIVRVAMVAFVLNTLIASLYGEPLASPVVAQLFWMAVAFETVHHARGGTRSVGG